MPALAPPAPGARPETLNDPAMLDRWKALEETAREDRNHILCVVDSLIHDAHTRRAYGAGR